MYRIIGGDQQEYGPVGEDEIRRWISEGRLNGRSLVKEEAATEWRSLAEYPEFAATLQAQMGQGGTATAAAPPPLHAETWSAEILARTPELHVSECLSRAWQLTTQNFGLLLAACALIWVASMAPVIIGVLPFIKLMGSLVSLAYQVMYGVFYGGLYLVFLKTIRGEQTNPGEAFSGFSIAFGQLLLTGFLSVLLAKLGFCFCVIPWIYLTVAWVFSVPLVADKRLEFWSAMELSRKVVTKVWFEMLALILVAFLPTILAWLLAGTRIGFVLFPFFRQIADMGGSSPDVSRLMQNMMRSNASIFALSFFARLVLLFNLPFALAALMFAYEDLFGPRTPAKS